MAGLNVSLSFFLATCALCQAARRASRALLSAGAYASFAREVAAAAQLAACCLEMQVLMEIGPWAGGFGPDLLLTLVFLLFLVHGATFDGASANPSVALQDFLMAEASLSSTLLKLAAQGLGMQAAHALARRCWAWELSELHLVQSLMAAHCSSALRTSVPQGTLVEGACAFFFHLALLRLPHSAPVYRVPTLALLVTVMTYVGMVLAVLLHEGCLPRLFQRNLLYRQKSKFRTPKGKLAPGSEDRRALAAGCRGQELGQGRAAAAGLLLSRLAP
ncbi:aquaporin-12-like isoform X2 [Marmota marmota marmota]|uniref:aquaporin-12-like isoform X2 n=1 Tax=Marmota marmota marmota TaxID=9994 RepID=UPI0020922F83|nr:aquaporin-12-like isoform X2 [Marmota marmota marmota]